MRSFLSVVDLGAETGVDRRRRFDFAELLHCTCAMHGDFLPLFILFFTFIAPPRKPPPTL
jgi:hypothetical protein